MRRVILLVLLCLSSGLARAAQGPDETDDARRFEAAAWASGSTTPSMA